MQRHVAHQAYERLRDALTNMMGVYDTPLARRRYPPDDFMQECIKSARVALGRE